MQIQTNPGLGILTLIGIVIAVLWQVLSKLFQLPTTDLSLVRTGVDTTIVDPFNIETALLKADEYNALCGCTLHGTYASSDADKARLVASADLVFCTAKAGVQVLNADVLADAKRLKVAGDVNAVPPLGIEGVKLKHFGEPLVHVVNAPGAVGIGALAVGDVKYRLQNRLLALMLSTEKPVYLDFRDAFQRARELV